MNLKIARENILKLIKKYYKEKFNQDVEISIYSDRDDRTDTPYSSLYIHYNVGISGIKAEAEEFLTKDKLNEIVSTYLDEGFNVKSLYLNTVNNTVGYGYMEHTELEFAGVELELERKNEKIKKMI